MPEAPLDDPNVSNKGPLGGEPCACLPAPAGVEIGTGIDAAGFGAMHWLVRRLGDRWTIPILVMLQNGPMRFAKLKRAISSISQRMLTLTLKKLERDGLIRREETPSIPPQVTYELTALGSSLVDRLATFDNWLDDYRPMILAANLRYGKLHHGQLCG